MGELQEMFENPSDLAAHGVALALAQILDLLRDMLAVKPVVAGPHRAQHVGLVLRPGIEIVVVSGSVGARSIGHGRLILKKRWPSYARFRSARGLLRRSRSGRRAG